MCGVFGFIADGPDPRTGSGGGGLPGRGGPDLKLLRRLATVTEQRGPHAFGFAWVDGRGRLRSYRQTGRITDHLGLLAAARDARLLIGHTRWATQGDPADNLNNHPHAADGGWIVHNGMIPRYRRLNADHALLPSSDCDSETLAMLVESLDGTLTERCARAVELVAERPTVLLGLWTRPRRLVAVRAGNPLHLGRGTASGGGGGTYMASLPDALPNARPVPDDSTLTFTLNAQGAPHARLTPLHSPSRSDPLPLFTPTRRGRTRKARRPASPSSRPPAVAGR